MFVTSPTELSACVESFDVYGFGFRLRTNVPVVRQLFGRLYRDFRAANALGIAAEAVLEMDGGHFIWKVGDRSGTNRDLRGALINLEAVLCETIIRWQQQSIAIHAATIQVQNSSAMLVGRSTAGKTTLSLALTRRGYPAAGDDVALVQREELSILPIPRCFHVDDRGAELLRADGFEFPEDWRRFGFMVPGHLGPQAPVALNARWLIFLRDPRAEHARLAPISQAEMTALILSETGRGPLEDSEIIQIICRLAAQAGCFVLTPGPFAETADVVADLLSRRRACEG